MDTHLVLQNPYDFCLHLGERSGRLSFDQLDSRTHDRLASLDGHVDYHIIGSIDSAKRAVLKISLQANASLICQRCLEPIDSWPLDTNSCITLFTDEQRLLEASEHDGDLDGMLVSGELSLKNLIEDEFIMALPIASMHDTCHNTRMLSLKLEASPFAALKSLKFPSSHH
jgi:uncharacterized protein